MKVIWFNKATRRLEERLAQFLIPLTVTDGGLVGVEAEARLVRDLVESWCCGLVFGLVRAVVDLK